LPNIQNDRMNEDEKTKNNIISRSFFKIKKWPDNKKTLFSIFLALFLTILIVVFWYGFGLRENKEEKEISKIQQERAITSMKSSFGEIVDVLGSQINEFTGVINKNGSSSKEQVLSTTTSTSSSEDVVQ